MSSSSSPSPCRRRRGGFTLVPFDSLRSLRMSKGKRAAFTLVELLVVIGIIALLISMLLPALNSARKQADRVKCLAAMQQLGQAYNMYSIDNQGFWPVAYHQYTSNGPAPLGREKRWHDFIGKYVNGGRDINYNGTQAVNATDPIQIWSVKDSNNILWGCPTWSRAVVVGGAFVVDPTGLNGHPGYAMSMYPHAPVMTNFPNGLRANRAHIDTHPPVTATTGKYYRQSQWKNASETALIAESVHANLAVPLPPWAYQPDTATPMPLIPAPTTLSFDFNRHSKVASGTKPNVAGMNMLFADGHASSVSVREAYRAVVKQ
ncbi:MAG: type II secretion system protein [Tepidisphaeraceae bacterium]